MRECKVIRMERKGRGTAVSIVIKISVREESWFQERSYGVRF